MTKQDRLELRLDGELREKLDELANLKGVAASAVVRRAIVEAHRAAFPDRSTQRPGLVVRQDAAPAPPSILELHTALWGQPPSPLQRALYSSYGRGYINGATDEHVDAVMVMAFYIAPMRATAPVAVLVPPELRALVVRRVTRAKDAARNKAVYPTVEATVERMKMGIPPAWWPIEPPVWVAVGIINHEGLPKWLRRRLVETP